MLCLIIVIDLISYFPQTSPQPPTWRPPWPLRSAGQPPAWFHNQAPSLPCTSDRTGG